MLRIVIISILLAGCREKAAEVSQRPFADSATPPSLQTDTKEEELTDTLTPEVTVVPVKRPSGIYRFIRKADDQVVEHTVLFRPGEYRLQERYVQNDSVIISRGTWATSDGKIWLYSKHIRTGQYNWRGNDLIFSDPVSGNKIPMEKMLPVSGNAKLANKGRDGVQLYGVGNEPFWNLQLTVNDTMAFHLSGWPSPVLMKVKNRTSFADSLILAGANDTADIQVTVLQQFCSDGMSDYTYQQKMRVIYNGQAFHGCAIVYKIR